MGARRGYLADGLGTQVDDCGIVSGEDEVTSKAEKPRLDTA
jgi:hypothetical protein